MEAYCNTVRALEDKFYGIELNHVPHRYNEEADELAKTLQKILWSMTVNFRHGSSKFRHKMTSMTKFENVMY
jgi:hypothetical protein